MRLGATKRLHSFGTHTSYSMFSGFLRFFGSGASSTSSGSGSGSGSVYRTRQSSLFVPPRRTRVIALLALECLLLMARDALCLEMLGISGPSSVNEGDTVTLTCRYDLGRDAIYSIKWFKGDAEVYRYIPTDDPEYKTFDLPGIKVDTESTRPNQLVVKVTGPLASGQYKCEITVETPSFVTLDRSLNLTVIVPPRLAPQITGIDTFYRPGDLVEIQCTSKDSKPAARLKWRLNGRRAPGGLLLPYRKVLNESSGLETSWQGLRFVAEEAHFPNGELRLTCQAEIEGVWKTHIEGVALGGGGGGGVAVIGGGGARGRGYNATKPNHLLVRNGASGLYHTSSSRHSQEHLHHTLLIISSLIAVKMASLFSSLKYH